MLVALFLLGSGVLAIRYVTENASRDQKRFIVRPNSYGISQQQLVQTLVTTYLPTRFLNGGVEPISRERNTSVLKSVFEVFDPSLRSFLESVPIVLDSSADTAKAYPAKGYIGVSPDWDKSVLQSRYRAIYAQRGLNPEDPVFGYRFKADLLIHEFLHILQVHLGIDRRLFYEAVVQWYIDRRYGIPSPDGLVDIGTMNNGGPNALAHNRMKYILWHALYNYQRLSGLPQDESWKNMQYGKRYRSGEKGVEEFAYIGQEILSAGGGSEDCFKTGQRCGKDWKTQKLRMMEVSPEVISAFRGVFNPELMVR